MRPLPATLALSLLLAGTLPATAAELSASDQAGLDALVGRFSALMAVDLGYCEYEYPDFAAGYRALIGSHEAELLNRLVDYHGLEMAAPAHVEHNPVRAVCLQTLEAARKVYADGTPLIERLAAYLPAAGERQQEAQ